jgi:Tfp pilus assembly protein PilV
MFFKKKLKTEIRPGKRGEVGASLIEVVVSLFILVLVLSVFSASLITFRVKESNQNRNLAYSFAEAELDAMNNYPFGSLTERTDGDFVGLAYNIGQQKIASDAGAVSPAQVQTVAPASVMVGSSISSAALLPESYYGDFTLSAYLKVLPSSVSNWQTGIVFRYQDIENYYYWSITSGLMKFIKFSGGAPTILWTASQTFNTGAWYKLKVVTLGTSLKVYLDDVLKTDQSDGAFANGYLGFVGQNSVYYNIDDIHLESSIKNSDWLFDMETVDSFPAGFLKISPAELAGLAGKLTIQNYSGAEIKKITAKVVWQERGSAREIQLSTLRSKVYE